MSETKKISNIIPQGKLKEIQLDLLEDISNAVMHTAGPYGTNTMILKDGEFPIYSKDGKKVLDSIRYHGPIETAITDELSQLTGYVVKEVGDGTTSAIRLSYYIFKGMMQNEKSWKDYGYTSHQIIDTFQKAVDAVKERIFSHGKETMLSDIYDICMISTNGNHDVSISISEIYKKYGADVFIDIGTSPSEDHIINEYDGITLERGYTTNAYINTADGKCDIRNASIYYFRDTIDTPEMIAFLNNIIYKNIIIPLNGKDNNAVYRPTVILAPSISRDAENILSEIEKMMYSNTPANRPDLLVVTDVNRYMNEVDDIAKLCGCKPIKKYIDPTVHDKDVELGNAPTINTILDFCGHADEVIADYSKTKFINPADMYVINSETGEKEESDVYKGLLNNTKAAIESAKATGENDPVTMTMLKRRYNTLRNTLVEYLIGGISATDREACRDLAEDAILNCRAAIRYGIGQGCNFEGLRAATEILNETDKEDILMAEMLDIIVSAYQEITIELYETLCADKDTCFKAMDEALEKGIALNLRTDEFDGKVKTSINTDTTILEGISRIITIAFTSNQALLPDPLQATAYK